MRGKKQSYPTMEYHEAANIFPLMEGEELEALAEDIRQNGQREPIYIYQNKILDGRNRDRAIRGLQHSGIKIEPQYKVWGGKGSPISFVVSLNLHRRHLSESQRAMVAAKIANAKKGGSRGNQYTGGKVSIDTLPLDKAAEALNVSTESAKRASKVLKSGDEELIAAVEGGEVSVSAAATAVDASNRYPELARLKCRPHDRATMGANLDKLPEAERKQKLALIKKGDDDTITSLANKPPMPKPRPQSAQDSWRDFFDDTQRALSKLGAHGTFSKYVGLWEYDEKEWFLGRLRDLMQTLSSVEDAALGSFDYDEGTAGADSKAAVH